MTDKFFLHIYRQWRGWVMLALVLSLMLTSYLLGFWHYLKPANLVMHHHFLQHYISRHWAVALLIYCLVYIALVALSIPGASFLTLASGLLFGAIFASMATVLAATLGACLMFLTVRCSWGDALLRRAGPRLQKLENRFTRNGFHYLLFLRLVPVFPFWLINIAAALSRVPLATFCLATLVGIVPGTVAIALTGAGLRQVVAEQDRLYRQCLAQASGVDCTPHFSSATFLSPQLLMGLGVLGLMALLPIFIKRRGSSHADDV